MLELKLWIEKLAMVALGIKNQDNYWVNFGLLVVVFVALDLIVSMVVVYIVQWMFAIY